MESSIVIAGGSKGLGLALAAEALSRGYRVALLGRSQQSLEEAKKKLGASGKITIHVADLSDESATQTAMQEVTGSHKSVRALVNCAATWMGKKHSHEFTGEEMKKAFELNFLSAFHASRAIVADWNARGGGELSIINIGATASLRGGVGSSAFCVAKAALRSFSQSLAKEIGPKGIHVGHVVIDGLIDNERTKALNPGIDKASFMNPESIAKSILHVIEQDRSCWTFEWDVRPNNEKW